MIYVPVLGGEMRKLVPVLVAIAAAFTTAIAAAPAAEAAATSVTRGFRIVNGNTYTIGKVIFYNRSVVVEGEQKSVGSSGCRKTSASTHANRQLGRNEWSYTCSGSEKFSFTVPAHIEGGAVFVQVLLINGDDVNDSGNRIGEQLVYRNG